MQKDIEWTLLGQFTVDSGQGMIGDPCYLDTWQHNRDEEWDIEGKEGQYSYHGASATTLSNNFGELEDGRSVVFSTGYGDGIYNVYGHINDEGRVGVIVIDFTGEYGEWKDVE